MILFSPQQNGVHDMRLELRVLHRDGKEVLQQRYSGMTVELPPIWKLFAEAKVELMHSEWTDVPHERE
jgi:hypothetical protein